MSLTTIYKEHAKKEGVLRKKMSEAKFSKSKYSGSNDREVIM